MTNRVLREETISHWQRNWQLSSRGRWTHRLIPELKPWIQRRHGQVDFYVAQLLSGHGCFKAYLYRFNHERNPFCDHCGEGVIEDAEHVVFHCPLFRREREHSMAHNIPLTPDTIVGCMLESDIGWATIANMAAAIFKELRRRERNRREEEA